MSDERLMTLEEFNRQRLKQQESILTFPKENGIACPECGGEMVDSAPAITLLSDPEQKNVHCPKCGFKGFRYA